MPTASLADIVLYTKDSPRTANHLEVLPAIVVCCNTGGTLGLHVFDPAGAFAVGSAPASEAGAPGCWHPKPAAKGDPQVGDVVQFVRGDLVGVGVVGRVNVDGSLWLTVLHPEGRWDLPTARDEAAFRQSPVKGELGFWRARLSGTDPVVGERVLIVVRDQLLSLRGEPEAHCAAFVLRMGPSDQQEVLGFDAGGGTFQDVFPPEGEGATRFWRQRPA